MAFPTTSEGFSEITFEIERLPTPIGWGRQGARYCPAKGRSSDRYEILRTLLTGCNFVCNMQMTLVANGKD